MAGKAGQKGTKATDVSKRFRADFLEQMDGRVAAVKTLHERLSALVTDLGGLDALSYQERSLCKRAIHLERLLEHFEGSLAHGGAVDYTQYFSMINTLSGLFTKLGLKRRAKAITLADYLKPAPGPDHPASPIHNQEVS